MGATRPPFLGELELAVMDHLWTHESGDAKDVHRAIGRRRRITLNTIGSTLKRLFEKGLLLRDKVSHAHVYSPRMSRTEFHQSVLQEVVDTVMDGEANAMLAAFVGLAEQVGSGQLEQLEELVAERLRARKDGDS
jgi:predicted transcriptional regulator